MSIDLSNPKDPGNPKDPADPEDPARPRPERRPARGWFRAFWRWHLYASFLVVPVLLVLATTGLIYLLRFEIEPLLHRDLMRVEQVGDFTQPYAAQEAAVQREFPNAAIVSMTEPAGPDRATVFSVELADGAVRDVFVNPWGATVLGSLDPDTTLSGYAVRIHGELMAGPWGDHLIELGACWAIVMALTGYYLFFKGRRARARQPRSLRSWHARAGFLVGGGLLFLLVSGLPWTGVWGERVQELATERGTSMWSLDPGAVSDPASTLDESLPHSHSTDVPWAMGESEVPSSTGDPHDSVASIDTAIAVADAEGLRHPMTVSLPGGGAGGHGDHGGGGDGVFSVIGYAFDAPSDERTVHVDRYRGQVVSTYGFDDYPLLAKVVSQGIGLHEGRSLGLWSFWGAALMCSLVIFSCVSGPVMWWRRRPGGSVGAPKGRLPLRSSPLLVVALVALGVFLPLFGLSLLAVLALDQVVVRRVPALARWFDSA